MIKRESIDKLLDITQIEDVIGDFITLKRRGVNQIGLCPFHDEKTPSFTVSPAKGIFKCFGCGESGNAIGFVMKHEQIPFVDAVRHIANKYNFTLEETEDSAEEKQLRDERESLYIINNFAKEYFQHNLLETEEGRNIGLTYFKERGFTEKTIKEFGLGYAFEGFHNFLNFAIEKQHSLDLLMKAGLVKEKNTNHFDFFRERVMFPIHNTSGKVVAFAGRTLKTDKKLPKYVNSPESDVYSKSRILYGMYLAKGEIRKHDQCFLVEGYTDVISLHQAGVENVVASSGTSLTEGQVKLIKRYTQNITLLFDGDAAGLNAAMRGVDLILPQDVNVKIVALPENHDPDSFMKEKGYQGFLDFIQENSKDFILFKLETQLADRPKDPVNRANATKSVVESIALIPDSIKRTFYIRECSNTLQIEEQLLHLEVNKARRSEYQKQKKISEREKEQLNQLEESKITSPAQGDHVKLLEDKSNFVEREVVRVLLEYGHFQWETDFTVMDFILFELEGQNFQNPQYQKILTLYRDAENENQQLELKNFIKSDDNEVVETVISLTNSPYELSEKWTSKHEIFIETDKEDLFEKEVKFVLSSYKLFAAQQLLEEKMHGLKKLENEQVELQFLKEIRALKEIIKQENDTLLRNYYLH